MGSLYENHVDLKNAYTDEAERRWYQFKDGIELPSSTSILALIVPPRLKNYFVNNSKNKQAKVRNETALQGYVIEDIIINDLEGKEQTIPEPYTRLYENWLKVRAENEITAEASQKVVRSDRYGYAGRLDFVGTINGKPAVFDVKSGFVSKKAALQEASYAQALCEMFGQKDYELVTIQAHRETKLVKMFKTVHKKNSLTRFLCALELFKLENWKLLEMKNYPNLLENANEVYFADHFAGMVHDKLAATL